MLCKTNFSPHIPHQNSADVEIIFQPMRLLDFRPKVLSYFKKSEGKKRKEKKIICYPALIGL